MSGWAPLRAHLESLRIQHRERRLRDWTPALTPGYVQVEGRTLLDLASNDYLGLGRQCWTADTAADLLRGRLPEPEAGAVLAALTRFGAGASRLVTGNDSVYGVLERQLARLKGREAALVLNSGYAANTGVIPALVGRGDAVFSDALNHASIIDGITLSRAERFVYRHRDLAHLDELLRASSASRKLIVTDALFSMDGTLAPLPELVDLKRRHGAWLMIDEAHTGGVYGAGGAGLAHAQGVSSDVDVLMGTLGKAYGSVGAYIAGDAVLIRFLLNTARPFIFSTGLPPANVAVSLLNVLTAQDMDRERGELQANAAAFRARLLAAGHHLAGSKSQVIPLVMGEDGAALDLAASLQGQGFGAIAIRPPSVPAGTARIRFALNAVHTRADLERCLGTVLECRAGTEELQSVGV